MTLIAKSELISIIINHYRLQLKEVMLKLFEFQEKYGCLFTDFENRLKTYSEENFEDWDNYMEWKANFNVAKELNHKIKDIIIRWDNAPHYPQLSSFPHHKHLPDSVEESQEMTLKEALDFIKSVI
jgi:hypothetical protein